MSGRKKNAKICWHCISIWSLPIINTVILTFATLAAFYNANEKNGNVQQVVLLFD